MRYSIMLVVFLFVSFSIIGQPSNGFFIKGEIDGLMDGANVYLVHNGGNDTADHVKSRRGKFNFKGILPRVGEFFFIRLDTQVTKKASKAILLDNKTIQIKSSLSEWPTVKVVGSPLHDEYLLIRDSIVAFNERFHEVDRQIKIVVNRLLLAKEDADSSKILELQSVYEHLSPVYSKLAKENGELLYNLVSLYPKSPFIAYSLLTNPSVVSFETLKICFEKLSEEAKVSHYGNIVREWIAAGNLAPGAKVNDFEGIDPDGNPISLKAVLAKNKYVLIDFWASWCVPCRAENPTLKKAYERFSSKGFTILSVSSDYNPIKWKEAIKKDEMTWFHMIDRQYSAAVSKTYGINALPAWFLVDQNGLVIETDCVKYDSGGNLRDEKLEAKLEELFQMLKE